MINPQDRISVDPKAALSTCLAASASCARAGSLISKAGIQSCELETSVGAHSSVDRQGCTDDVGCLVRANEHDGIGNFFGSADALVRNLCVEEIRFVFLRLCKAGTAGGGPKERPSIAPQLYEPLGHYQSQMRICRYRFQ